MNYKKYSLYLIGVALFASSCKKQLNLNDPDLIGEENAFVTFDHVVAGLNAAHSRYSAYATDMYANALLSDEAKLGVNNAGQGALTYRYQFSADATTGADATAGYFPYYSLIDQVNRVLPNVYTVTATGSQEASRDAVKGQLLAMRALGHFGALQAFSKVYNATERLGVPIMLVSSNVAKPVRNTMGEVMTQIEADLNAAKTLLPAVTPTTFADTAINKINITAYQARIALYKGDYAAAVTYATEVINSNVKPLVTGTAFAGIWTDANNNETLFRVRYATSNAIGSMFTAGSNIYVAPSDKLVATYATGDIRKAAYVGTTGGNNYVNKFYTSSRGARIVDIKAIRTAEMYLIRAEAYAKLATPNLAAGEADLNTLRTQRITGYVNQTFTTAGDLITAVLAERFKELAFEGFRFYDLKRNGLPVQRNASDASAAWQTLPANSFRFILPIPQAEINANPNMEQNTGY
jgi:hypothetical protein